MGKILSSYLLPHPPILIKEIGKGEEKKAKATIEGMEKASRAIKEYGPSTIIIITPHGPLFRDAIALSLEEDLSGDFSRFGHGELGISLKNNLELAESIRKNSIEEDIPIIGIDKKLAKDYRVSKDLDHGALVPLYFLNKEYKDYKLIHITYGLLEPEELFKFGEIIGDSVEESGEEVVIIASGDLSHKLSKDGPYDYSEAGKIFDEKLVDIIREARLDEIVSFDLDLAERAGECGLRSLMIMAGAIDRYNLETEVYSYEGPFGVGYASASFKLLGKKESKYVRLARKSLEYYVKNGEKIKDLDENKNMQRGVFVTLMKNGQLRGCIGTISPTKTSVEMEIVENAISAGTRDPRFPALREEELEDLVYSVDILEEAEKISSIDELDIEKYGVIVTKGYRRGLLLPNLEGIDSVEEQVGIALDKAGIGQDEDYQLERFEVKRYY